MVNITFLLLSVLTIWTVYWMLLRPCFLDQVDTDFERLKSSVDWAIIEKLPESQARPALVLARELDSSSAARSLSVSVIIYGLLRHRSKLSASVEKDRQIFRDAEKWIREARDRNVRLTMKAALVNSPSWWLPLAALLLATYFSQKLAHWWDDFQNAGSIMRSEGLTA